MRGFEILCNAVLDGVDEVWGRVRLFDFDVNVLERSSFDSGKGDAYVFDKDFDVIFFERIRKCGVSVLFDSEERDNVITIGQRPEYYVLIDPVDGSEMLSRGVRISSTAVSIISLESLRPLFSVILDHRDGALVVARGADGIEWIRGEMKLPRDVTPSEAFCVSYFAKSGRLSLVGARLEFYEQFRTIFNYGGSCDFLRVASGVCDYFVEIEKGFHARDFLPGAHILRNSGGYISDERGSEIGELLLSDRRTKFVACPSKASCEDIVW
jgi:fructose-1,6-bisphosphatase/inositol monophosphatase family enzyme